MGTFSSENWNVASSRLSIEQLNNEYWSVELQTLRVRAKRVQWHEASLLLIMHNDCSFFHVSSQLILRTTWRFYSFVRFNLNLITSRHKKGPDAWLTFTIYQFFEHWLVEMYTISLSQMGLSRPINFLPSVSVLWVLVIARLHFQSQTSGLTLYRITTWFDIIWSDINMGAGIERQNRTFS
jgi:hypothetical protein